MYFVPQPFHFNCLSEGNSSTSRRDRRRNISTGCVASEGRGIERKLERRPFSSADVAKIFLLRLSQFLLLNPTPQINRERWQRLKLQLKAWKKESWHLAPIEKQESQHLVIVLFGKNLYKCWHNFSTGTLHQVQGRFFLLQLKAWKTGKWTSSDCFVWKILYELWLIFQLEHYIRFKVVFLLIFWLLLCSNYLLALEFHPFWQRLVILDK